MAYEAIRVEIDEDIYNQAQKILEANNLTMEQALQMFFIWVVQNPDEAKGVLGRWQNAEMLRL